MTLTAFYANTRKGENPMRTLLIALLALSFQMSPASAAEKKPVKVQPLNIDANKDGKISLSEAETLAEKQFALYDRNKNGEIDEKEYRAPMDVIAKAKKFDAKKKAMEDKVIKESLGRIDLDDNGQISKDEFIKDAAVRQKIMDLNHDGFVTPEEVDELQAKIKAAQKKAAASSK
jgi:hypothetical protein